MRRVNGKTTARMRRLQKDKNRKQTTEAGKDQSWCDMKLRLGKYNQSATHKKVFKLQCLLQNNSNDIKKF